MEQTICNLCQETKFDQLHTVPDLLLNQKENQATFVRCPSCGLIYQNPRPTVEEMNQHYPPDYDSYNLESDTGDTSWLQDLTLQYGLKKRSRFITREKNGGRLLDIGCATGQFMREMGKHPGWEVAGIEINPHAARIAIEKFGLDVFNGTLEEAQFPASFFDAITLWDVLEHLHDPSSSLREIHRILKPEGIMVIRVPNGGGWDARVFGKYWFGWDAPRHLYVFNSLTIRELYENNGFEIRRITGGLGGYNSIILSLRFWLAAREMNPRARKRIERIVAHPISRLFTAPFFFFLSIGSTGPFLIVTADRRS